MTYTEATRKSEQLLQEAKELSEKYHPDGGVNWAFVAGCLQADIKLLLMGTHRIAKEK